MRSQFLVIGLLAPFLIMAGTDDEDAEKYFPQKLTAQELLKYCASSALSGSGRSQQSYCSGFVSGVEESVRLLDTDAVAGDKKMVCVPKEKSAGHLRDAYIRHAAKKTTDLKRPAVMVVLEALRSVYPCDE